jgi:glutathione S-transferase
MPFWLPAQQKFYKDKSRVKMKLYNIDGCGYCAMVRNELAQMGLEYEKIDGPWSHPERKEVYEVSGQTTVPVLVDGDTVLADEYEIIDYLKKTYPVNS